MIVKLREPSDNLRFKLYKGGRINTTCIVLIGCAREAQSEHLVVTVGQEMAGCYVPEVG